MIIEGAFDRAEKFKLQQARAWKRAALNRNKPKQHSWQSIKEEMDAIRSVNIAWQKVKEGKVKKHNYFNDLSD